MQHKPVRRKQKRSAAKAARPRPARRVKAGAAGKQAVSAPADTIKIPKKFQPAYASLVRLREHVARQINFLAADNLTRTEQDVEVDFRSKEQGTDNFDRDFALNRVSLDQNIIFEIDEALGRIRLGSYGKCESCGSAIERLRLAALPYSRMCVACQSKLEGGARRGQAPGALYPLGEKPAAEGEAEDE